MFRDKSDSQAEFMKAYEKSSQLNKGKFLHAYLDIVGDTQREAAETMKLELGTKKLLRALYRGHVYICETPQEELDFQAIDTFIADVHSGKIKPILKSEPIPTSDEGPVKVIVGKTHADIVNDPTKHVLVEYYAPWCGFCKKLAPIYEELAATNTDPDLVIAKIDNTQNENEKRKINAYPTLYLFTKNNKEGVEYEGKNELEPIRQWIKELTQQNTKDEL